MKKRPIVSIIITFIILLTISVPLSAGEELMTRHFFDNWLRTVTAPLEQQIIQLRTAYTEMENTLRTLKSQMTTEIILVIGQSNALVDGRTVGLSVPPVIENGRTMVPVRFIGENFGASFTWDEKTSKVTYNLAELTIELVIGKKTAKVNGRNVSMDVPPYIKDGRTMVPLRFVGEHMEASFAWDEKTRTVTISR